jgi:hypothetical protein
VTPLHADDPDAYVDDQITDANGGTNDWVNPTVKSGATSIACTWLGEPGPTRTLRTPLTSLGPGEHRLRLVVPGDTDLTLESVYLN